MIDACGGRRILGCALPSSLPKFSDRADIQVVARNFGWLVAEKLARLALGVCVGFVVARYLGPAQFGSFSYALAVAGIGVVLAEAGLATVVTRELVRGVTPAGELLAAAARIRLLAGALCYVAVLVGVALGSDTRDERVLLAALGLLLFQPALAVSDLWLQAHLQARLSMQAQLAGMLLGALVRIGLVLVHAPLIAFAVAPLGEAVVAAVLLRWFARRTGQPAAVSAGTERLMRGLWTDSWPLLLSGLTVMIYMRLDLVMLRHMAGEAAAGEYAAASRLSEVWFFLPGAFAASMLPSLLRAKEEGVQAYRSALQRFFDLSSCLAYAVSVPTVVLSSWLVHVAYGTLFAGAGPILLVHGWTLLWAALGVARGQYCVNEGYVRFQLLATTSGAVLNIGLNLWLIPRYGGIGAAWATLASQAVAAWTSSFFYGPLRDCAAMQTRALLAPLRYLFRLFAPSS